MQAFWAFYYTSLVSQTLSVQVEFKARATAGNAKWDVSPSQAASEQGAILLSQRSNMSAILLTYGHATNVF